MRARNCTVLNTRRRLITLATCLPSQNELDFHPHRTSYISWMKRYYFLYPGFSSLFLIESLFLLRLSFYHSMRSLT